MSVHLSTYEKRLAREIKEVPKEYLPNLLLIVRVLRESVALKPAEASFRQGWKEVMAGETHPVTEIWKGIEAQ
jgi:hypothetical protein